MMLINHEIYPLALNCPGDQHRVDEAELLIEAAIYSTFYVADCECGG
jgi:hypothetical protein